MKLWGFIAPHLLRDDHYPKLRGSLRPKVLTHSQLWLFDFSMSVRSKICQRRSADFWGFMSGRFLNDVRRYIQHWSKYNHTGIDMEKSNRKQWNLFFWTSSIFIHILFQNDYLNDLNSVSCRKSTCDIVWPSHTDYSSFCTWNFTQETPIPSTKKQVHIIPKR